MYVPTMDANIIKPGPEKNPEPSSKQRNGQIMRTIFGKIIEYLENRTGSRTSELERVKNEDELKQTDGCDKKKEDKFTFIKG